MEFDRLTGSAITEAHWDRFFEFYTDTGSRKWGHPYLTREFFSRIGASMADQILLVMAKRGGRYIAGALNLFGEGILYRPQLGRGRISALPAFRDLLLSGDRFRHCPRLEQGGGGGAGRAQIAARLYAGGDLQRPLHRPSGPGAGGG